MNDGMSSFGPGTVIGGKYRLDAVIGQGNMGLVAAGWDLAVDRRVAVKLMSPGRIAEEQRARFVREARTAAKLRSEHVVRVLDVSLDAAAPYLVMEFLEGRDLAGELEARGPFRIEDAVECVLQACEALGEAHAAGIVHRDVKPANLFLTRSPGGMPHVKVVDFGIARLGKDSHLTQEGKGIGSPLYMSPEQMRDGRDADGRADVWSLGVTLELLAGTGKTPFDGDDLPSVATHVHLDPPVPLPKYRPDVPPQLWAIIQQCLEKARERRWPSCAELAAALVPFGPARAAQYAGRVAATLGARVSPLAGPTLNLGQSAAPFANTVAATATTGAGTAVVQPKQDRPARRRALVAVAMVTALAGTGLVGWRVVIRGLQPAVSGSASAETPPMRPPDVAPTEADAGVSQPGVDAAAPEATAPATASATAAPDAGGPGAKGKPAPAARPPAGEPATQPKTRPAKPHSTTYQL